MTTLTPYLAFAGNAREAMTFYQSVFGGQLDLVTGNDFGLPPEQHDRIMHAFLRTEGWNLMAADSDKAAERYQGFSLSVMGTEDETAEAEKQIEQLAEGGSVEMKFEQQQWGARFGVVRDKYGITWQFNFGE
ncbi:VOC family protein [Corynebacterium vitaeruminis]|uniref:VOC family protein n=1 Tax=Corynebacterium vitaeruminis TaxID=38305 RepID=UPI0005570B00|nr:VOC family protein [Corynebacterium vitaeruminis]